MAAKILINDHGDTGATVYCIVRREATHEILDDTDGSFDVTPVDPYLSLIEDDVIYGRYEISEDRIPWADGKYTVAVYEQSGGSPSPIDDNIIGSGELTIVDDAEIVPYSLEQVRDIVLTSQLTESYAADGVAPTLAQFNFMVWSFLTNFGITGTAYAARQLDDSAAMGFTLNDATTPTDITRSS